VTEECGAAQFVAQRPADRAEVGAEAVGRAARSVSASAGGAGWVNCAAVLAGARQAMVPVPSSACQAVRALSVLV
jgi:hypothetical protein